MSKVYDNIITKKMGVSLPNPLNSTYNPTAAQYSAAGYRERVSIDLPTEGYVATAYEPVELSATTCKLAVSAEITQAEYDAQQAAAAEAIKEGKYANINVSPKEMLEIMVRIHNLKVPEQYKVTKKEALAIVHAVIFE